MKIAIAFIAGLIIASGAVYVLLSNRPPQSAAVQVAQVQPAEPEKPAPAPIVVESPVPEPSEPKPVLTPLARKPVIERRQQAAPVQPPAPMEIAPVVATPEPVHPPQPAAAPPPVAPSAPPEPEWKPLPPERAITPAPPPPPPPVERKPNTVTLAANTTLAVRLSETVSTDKQQAGDVFDATLDQPLVVDGLVVAERGSRVEGRIVSSERAGRVRGTAHLELELTKLNTADGQRLTIRTNTFQRDGETSKKEDAARVGIGAALGAAIGGMAGGGKGAGIGAGAGGAAGAGTVMATRGKPVVLPTETRVAFRLSLPITVTERLP